MRAKRSPHQDFFIPPRAEPTRATADGFSPWERKSRAELNAYYTAMAPILSLSQEAKAVGSVRRDSFPKKYQRESTR